MSVVTQTLNADLKGPIITARKRSLGQGNVFIGVCQEFCSQGGGCLARWGVSAPWGGSAQEGGVCSEGRGCLLLPLECILVSGCAYKVETRTTVQLVIKID